MIANDFPNLIYAPCLPAICYLLAHIAKDENQLLGLLVAIIKINYGKGNDISSLYSSNSAYSPKETRHQSFFFAHNIKDSKILSRAFGNALFKKNKKLHSHLKNLHQNSPKPFWDKWFAGKYISAKLKTFSLMLSPSKHYGSYWMDSFVPATFTYSSLVLLYYLFSKKT